MISSLALATVAASLASIAAAQGPDGNPWTGVGVSWSASFYWHNRYHGLLAMAAYGDYENLCPQTFTYESLQHQYPGNTNQPFQVVGKWGPTPKYKSEGYMVRVPEMNKILAVFKGQYGWQQYPAYLSPFNGVGCDGRCMAHTGALEAWKEVQEETNDFQAIKSAQQNLVWSISGHGFGGMIAQVAALDLKSRGLAYSIHTFGSPAVFNQASVNRWNDLFHGDDSQRTVANEDSIPTAIGQGYNITSGLTSNYTFVDTGIHVFGQSSMYGQDFYVCVDAPTDPRCAGGNVESDHYFYYTEIGTCGRGWGASYDPSENGKSLWEAQQAFNATYNGTMLPFNPSTQPPAPPAPTTTSSSIFPTATALNLTDASIVPTSTGAPVNNAAASAASGTENVAAGSAGVGIKVSGIAMVLAGLAVLFV